MDQGFKQCFKNSTMKGHEDKIALVLCFSTEGDIYKGKIKRQKKKKDKMKFSVLLYKDRIKNSGTLGKYLCNK